LARGKTPASKASQMKLHRHSKSHEYLILNHMIY
jgi:hypothetical protein